MVFDEVLIVFPYGNVESLVGNQAPFIEGVLVGVTQRDKFIVPLKIREGESRHPLNGF